MKENCFSASGLDCMYACDGKGTTELKMDQQQQPTATTTTRQEFVHIQKSVQQSFFRFLHKNGKVDGLLLHCLARGNRQLTAQRQLAISAAA